MGAATLEQKVFFEPQLKVKLDSYQIDLDNARSPKAEGIEIEEGQKEQLAIILVAAYMHIKLNQSWFSARFAEDQETIARG